MMRSPRLVIAGGSGFIGSALASAFVRDGYEVVVLSRARSTQSGPLRYVQWDGCNPGPWTTELEGANFIVNLSGSSVNCRHNEHNRRRLIDSRIKPVMALGAAIIAAENPPPVWINASGAGIYPESETPQGEDVLATGDDFIA
ncbi:MAG: NAD-dependent epimerase/dehydratase family protein, partial [Flavobacteriales bacterium]|nr:NAD-dependent epimerase/dehydratase family protein [Flavobacteriales bacterium]